MAELQLEFLASVRQSEELVPQTNAEDRTLADQLPQFLVKVGKSARITRAIRQKHPIRFHRQNVICLCCSWNDRHPETVLAQPSQNIELDTVVVSDDSMFDR